MYDVSSLYIGQSKWPRHATMFQKETCKFKVDLASKNWVQIEPKVGKKSTNLIRMYGVFSPRIKQSKCPRYATIIHKETCKF